jgi:hypothetical protein
MKCSSCFSSRVRRSRFRLADIPRLFLLELPIRCHSCYERDYVRIFRALKLGGAKRTARGREDSARRLKSSAAA